MSDSASSLRPRTYGIQRRVPAVPISEWRIKTSDQLPDNLMRILETYPPYLTTKRAADLNGGAVSKLYEHKDAGYIRCVKDGGTTLWETLSIVLRLANLPTTSIASDPPGSRRSRRQPVSAPPIAATPAKPHTTAPSAAAE